MPPSLVTDQEFVVHLFAPLDGPRAEQAYQQVLTVWSACRHVLHTTERIPSALVRDEPPPALDRLGNRPDWLLAAQQDPSGDRQIVLRRVHDVLNLSAALAQPRIAVGDGARRLGWAQFAELWSRACATGTDQLLGEAWLYLAKAELSAAEDGSAAALGTSLESFLPYREDRSAGLWESWTRTANGCLAWDLWPTSDVERRRELVILAPPGDDAQLSTWTWSNGRPGLPPLARYLMHAAKLRYSARLLEAWHSHPRSTTPAEMLAELQALFGMRHSHEQKAILGERLARLRVEETRLGELRAELQELRVSCLQAQDNLRRAAPDAVPFAVDESLAGWLVGQLADDLEYLGADLERVTRGQALVESTLASFQATAGTRDIGSETAPSGEGCPATPGREIDRQVFVVHGRDRQLHSRFCDLLRAVGLHPLEWEELVAATGNAAPHASEAVLLAPQMAQAAVALLCPEDLVSPHPDVASDSNAGTSDQVRLQPSADVLFQLGLAMTAYPHRTLIVTVGRSRSNDLLAGMESLRLDRTATSIGALVNRLGVAGCRVNTSGTDWLDTSRFQGLTAFDRAVPDIRRPGHADGWDDG